MTPAHEPADAASHTQASALDLGAHVLGVDHVGVAAEDADEAVALFGRLLGLVELHREVNDEQGVVEVMLGSPARPAAAPLQVLAPSGAESPLHRFLHRRGPGLQQLAYRVDDVEAVSRLLTERGVRLLYEQARVGTAGSRINFVHPADAGGVLLELVEPTGTGHADAS